MSLAERDGARVSSLSARVYRVPTDLPEADGTLAWSETTLVVAEAKAAGMSGLGWTYGAAASKSVIDDTLVDVVVGTDSESVVGTQEQMVRKCRNYGRSGVVASAISAVDVALWDLKAKLHEVTLVDLFGRCRDSVPVYGSGGFTTYDDETTIAQLEHWTKELGTQAVKIKIGESWGTNAGRDLARVELARRVIGEGCELFVDANGAYSRKQAIALGRRFVEESGVSWFEEPVSSDDLVGLHEVRDQLACDVAAGEYGYDEAYFAHMVAAQAIDCLQIDVTRCGGYTTWLRVAALAGANGLQVSGHCAPSLHVPVAASVPNLRHVEYFHDHERVDALLFDGAATVVDGEMPLAGDAFGHGMSLRPGEQFRVK